MIDLMIVFCWFILQSKRRKCLRDFLLKFPSINSIGCEVQNCLGIFLVQENLTQSGFLACTSICHNMLLVLVK